jgi:serine protease Do
MSVSPGLVRFATVALAALVVAVAGAAPALAQPADPEEAGPTERAAALVRPALVHVTGQFVGSVQDESGAYFNGGQPYQLTATCTGFGVHPDGYVATAAHCVDTRSVNDTAAAYMFIERAAQEVVASTPALAIEDVISYGLANWTVKGQAANSPIEAQFQVSGASTGAPGGAGLPVQIVDVQPDADVALLKVDAPKLAVLELATGAETPVGTPLLSAGYPGSVGDLAGPAAEPSMKEGSVSGRQTIDNSEYYEISAPVAGGMSGGPAVDLNGRVLGINSFGPSAESGGFAFIASATELAELLSSNGVRNELGPADRLYRDALDAYYEGRYSDAIAAFDRVLQDVPAHAQAGRLRADALAARDRFGDPGLPAAAYVGIAGGVVTLGIGAGVLIAVRRRRQRAAPVGAPWQQPGPLRPFPGQPVEPGWPSPAPFPGAAAGPMTGPMPPVGPPNRPFPGYASPPGPASAAPVPPPRHPYPGTASPWARPGSTAGWQPQSDGPTARIVLPAASQQPSAAPPTDAPVPEPSASESGREAPTERTERGPTTS